jgi:hypothetical protein
MSQFFMRRASAVAYLMERRRAWYEMISACPSGNIEFESAQIDLISRLIIDVRAGRVRSFELTLPQPVAIHVTDI